MSRLQFFDKDEPVWDQPAGLPINFGARAFNPSASYDVVGQAGFSSLTAACSGDWSWKPERYADGNGRGAFRFFVTGPRCSCTLAAPVGTLCARHRN